MQRLMIVVPCYNEEEILPYSMEKLTGLVSELIVKKKIASNSGVLFVNDGSKDRTWEMIQREYEHNPYVYGLGLAGNVGHQKALFAGLQTAAEICDVSISIDADLQDDIGVIEEMIDEYLAGADIVYGVRSERKTDTFFKRFTAQSFYRVMELMGVKTVYNHADFRLMNLIALILIGVSLFLLLFECRARYLYIFSPLYVVLAGIGLNKASELYGRIRGKRNQKMSGTIKIP